MGPACRHMSRPESSFPRKAVPRGWHNRILVVGLIAGQPLWTLAAIAAVTNFSSIRRLIFAMGKE